MAGLDHIVLYHQSPRLVASRVTAGQLGRRRLEWARLRDMDWILGPRHTALRTHIDSIFINEGLPPPEPTAECHSPHLIGQLVAGNNHAVSMPADIAEDLAHIAGLARPYSFDWHRPLLYSAARVRPHATLTRHLRPRCASYARRVPCCAPPMGTNFPFGYPQFLSITLGKASGNRGLRRISRRA